MRPFLKFRFKYILLFFFIPTQAWGAACCGSGFNSPALISGDERATATLAVSHGQVTELVNAEGYWRRQSGFQDQSVQLSGAKLLSDRWQAGAMSLLRYQKKSDVDAASAGMGDTALLLGFEALPEWVYSPLTPHVFTYMQLSVPTGRSKFESENNAGVDVTGTGFWTLGGGALATKIWGAWDAQLQFEVHSGFQRTFHNQNLGRIQVFPSPGTSALLAGGWSLADWRLGAGIRRSYEGPEQIRGDFSSEGSAKSYWTLILSAGLVLSKDWALSASYSDDTVLGKPVNTFLTKSAMVSFQRRWAR